MMRVPVFAVSTASSKAFATCSPVTTRPCLLDSAARRAIKGVPRRSPVPLESSCIRTARGVQ